VAPSHIPEKLPETKKDHFQRANVLATRNPFLVQMSPPMAVKTKFRYDLKWPEGGASNEMSHFGTFSKNLVLGHFFTDYQSDFLLSR